MYNVDVEMQLSVDVNENQGESEAYIDESSEYESYNDSEYDSNVDDMYYESNVAIDDEYVGISEAAKKKTKDKAKANGKKTIDWSFGVRHQVRMDGSDHDSDDLVDIDPNDDYQNRPKGRWFDEKLDMEKPKFELMMQFKDHKEFQSVVKRHGIKEGKQIKFTYQSTRKVKAVCKDPCPWSVYASKAQNEDYFVLKTFREHSESCGFHFKSKFTYSNWLAKTYLGEWKDDPNVRANSIKKKVLADYSMNVSRHQVNRAKEKAMALINGSVEYTKLWDYAEELIRRNPGSTVQMKLVDGSIEQGTPRFERFYVCLAGLKKGFKHCRPFLSVDGCFLKGMYGGQLLAASSIDPNNNWYPVAYAVVESESRDSWTWFFRQLIDDLKINDIGFTIMSDKQKGLVETVKELLPEAEHRFCVLHMLANMRSAGFKGVTYKNLLWSAARSTTVPRFKHWMEQMAEQDLNAYHWFDDKQPCNRSRSAFSTHSKCDILVNNLSESFNSYILFARDQPILSCLESIRKMLMTRLQENRVIAAKKWKGKLCPKIFKEVEKRKKLVNECIPASSGGLKYEVSCMYGAQYSVHLGHRTCTCRKWDLSGIPCSHAMSCIFLRGEDVEEYVDDCYSTQTYKAVYKYLINPMDGPDLSPKSGYGEVLPPIARRQPGRPRKLRRRTTFDKEKERERVDNIPVEIAHVLEDGTQKLKRRVTQKSLRCSFCKELGHNKRGCSLYKEKMAAEAENEDATMVEGDDNHHERDTQETMHEGSTENVQGGNNTTSQDPIGPGPTENVPNNLLLGSFGTQPPPSTNNEYHVPPSFSSQPPPGTMQMVVPAGREHVIPNQSFSGIGPSSPPINKEKVGFIKRGDRSYVTLAHLKAAVRGIKHTPEQGEGEGSQGSTKARARMTKVVASNAPPTRLKRSERQAINRFRAPKKIDTSVIDLTDD